MSEKLTPFPKDTAKRKKKLAVRILIKSLVYAFAIFGILFILLLLVILGLLRQEPGRATTIPRQTVLKINFDEAYREVRSDNLLTEISEVSPLSFYDLVKAINLAAIDDRVKVLVGRVGNSPLGLAQIQELRQAVATFRSKGKKAYIFSAGFGSFGGGTSEYYLASAFDEIWMQPNTDLGLTGIAMEVPFSGSCWIKSELSRNFTPDMNIRTQWLLFWTSGCLSRFDRRCFVWAERFWLKRSATSVRPAV